MKTFSYRKSVLSGVALGALALSGTAFAQDAEEDVAVEVIEEAADEEVRQEKIVVTGSLIARDEYSSASPIQVITAEVATLEGLVDTASLLQGSSLAAGSTQLNNTFQNFVTNGGVGTQTIDLRGCGDTRTLVLIDGKRPGPSGTRGAVSAYDLNVVPQSIISRVEVLKDGASTIYGSDAVCGVVNIITRDTIDSPELTFNGSLPFESGGEEFRVNGAFGLEFGDNIDLTFSAEYRLQQELNIGDRDYLECPVDLVRDPETFQLLDRVNQGANAATTDNCSNLYFNTVISGFSFAQRLIESPDGIEAPTAIQGLFVPGYRPRVGTGTNPDGTFFFEDTLDAPFLREQDFRPENENISIFMTADTTFGGVDWDSELLFNRRTTTSDSFRQFFPFVGSNSINNFGPGSGGAFGVNYISDPTYENSAGGLALAVLPYTSNTEVQVDYYSASTSLSGGFGDFLPDFSWKIDGTYSRGEGDYTNNQIQISKSGDWSLDGVADVNGDGIPDALAPPTIDYFDPSILDGSNINALIAAVGGDETGSTVYEQTTINGVIAGEAFELPAGPLGVAVGVEYREFSIDDQPGALTQAGDVWGRSTAGPTVGENSVTEIYGELNVPIFKGSPFAEQVDLSLSGRAFDYDLGGEDSIYKVGLNWQINETVRVRSSYGTSYRAPALFELFLEDQTSFAGQFGTDPCINYADPANNVPINIQNNCAADGIPGNYGGGAVSATVIQSGGGDLLEAESGDSFTAGIVFTPTFLDLNIALDYYEIEINDQITSLGAGTVVGGCYAGQVFPNRFCDLFTRNPATDQTSPFALNTINAPTLNVDSQSQRGIDLAVRYESDLNIGTLVVDGNISWSLERFTDVFGSDFISGIANNDFNGSIGFPSVVGDATVRLDRGDWTYSWFTNFTGRQDNNRFSSLDFNEPQTYLGRVPGLFDTNTEAVFYHGASVRWEGDTWSITGGVRNIFDEQPPTVSSGTGAIFGFSAGNLPVNATGYDILGRRAFVTVSKTF